MAGLFKKNNASNGGGRIKNRIMGIFKNKVKGNQPQSNTPKQLGNPPSQNSNIGSQSNPDTSQKNVDWQQEYYKNLIKEEKQKNLKRQYSNLFKLIIGFVIIVIVISIPMFLFYTHSGIFSYQIESFSGITSFFSPLFSEVSQSFYCLSSPISCVTTTSTVVNQTAPTFTSFLSINTPSQPQILFTSGSGYLFYDLGNTANVPLGANRPNQFSITYTCGSNELCQNLTSLGKNSKTVQNPVLLFPGSTIQQQFLINGKCPSNQNLAKQLPVEAQLYVETDVSNYSAGSIFPVNYINYSFYNQLLSSSQAFIPNQYSVVYVSPGPVQISISTDMKQPILSNTNLSMLVQIQNNGQGEYYLNNLTVFIPAYIPGQQAGFSSVSTMAITLPVNSGGGTQSINLNVGQCILSSGGQVQNFVFPGDTFFKCNLDVSSNPHLSSINFILPPPELLNNEHFDTIPILLYVNYNYVQNYTIPFIVENTTSCS